MSNECSLRWPGHERPGQRKGVVIDVLSEGGRVSPEGAPTEGDAVEIPAARFPGRPVVFGGDEEVDEDAFRSPAVSLPARVGHHATSGAGYFLPDQAAIDVLLRELAWARCTADERSRSRARRAGEGRGR